ncbi:MAG: hypothetical protein ABIS18_02520, partial [Actinomycetota bacterium]
MAEGFVVDYAYNSRKQSTWVPGKAKRNLLGFGVRVPAGRIGIEVFRCERCGFLESFANPQ